MSIFPTSNSKEVSQYVRLLSFPEFLQIFVRAHRYKAKQGFIVYRVRVRRGGRKKPLTRGKTMGKPKNHGIRVKNARNTQSVAEGRAGKRCPSLRVLSSYWINQDGRYKYFEVVMVDPNHKAIRRDPRINWLVNAVHKHREMRGLTSAGRKGRGLSSGKGYRTSKLRPSRRANWKRRNTVVFQRYR